MMGRQPRAVHSANNALDARPTFVYYCNNYCTAGRYDGIGTWSFYRTVFVCRELGLEGKTKKIDQPPRFPIGRSRWWISARAAPRVRFVETARFIQ